MEKIPLSQPATYEVMISEGDSLDDILARCERGALVAMLTRAGGNVSEVARLAKRNRSAVFVMLKRHNLKSRDFKNAAKETTQAAAR